EVGRTKDALQVIEDALARQAHGGARLARSELLRLQGEALLRQASSAQGEAEGRFLEAIQLARRQGARPFELRASISLARLWAQRGKRAAAREHLEQIYHWFTEGLDGVDQRAARALLATLS